MKLRVGPGVAVSGALLSFLLVATPAQAAVLGLSDARPVPGQQLTVTGGGCAPGVRVTVMLDGNVVRTVEAGRGGGFTARFNIPDGADTGEHRVTARCWDGDSRRNFGADIRVVNEISGPSTVDPGQVVSFSGDGCGPNEIVNVSFRGNRIDQERANDDGAYDVTFRIPSGARSGDAMITISCDQVYPPGSRHIDRKEIHVN